MKSRPFHPLLFGIYPIVALYARNAAEVRPGELAMPVAAALAATVALWLAAAGLTRESRRSAVLISLALLLFFTTAIVGPVADEALTYLSRYWVFRQVHVWPPYVFVPEILGVVALGFLLLRNPENLRGLTSFLNVFALVLVALPASRALTVRGAPSAVEARGPAPATAPGPGPAGRPDIYYIILDGYARTDVMRDLFGFDNGPFLDRLERLGFFVARRSTANYCQTRLSISSSLNAEYLDTFADAGTTDATWLRGMIGENAVIRSLRPHGYKFVTFSTGFDMTEHPEADYYISPYVYINGFHRMLLEGTPLAAFLPDSAGRDGYAMARERTLHVLKTLPEVAGWSAPTFTLAHIVSPHPPFVFGRDGEDVSPRKVSFVMTDGDWYNGHYGDDAGYVEGYAREAEFLTREVERTIGRILEASPEPPIIILQSDHGSGLHFALESLEGTDLRERMGILNAYYFPDRNYEGLDDRITPVNSFRTVLRRYFGAELPPLEDRSYYSTWSAPFRFIDVTDRVRSGPPPQPPAPAPASGGEPLRGSPRSGPPAPAGDHPPD